MTPKIVILTVQKWGNSLAVRIPAAMARRAHFYLGTAVELTVQDNGIAVKSTGERKLTLDERLEQFDPKKHGGEVMPSDCIGLEKF